MWTSDFFLLLKNVIIFIALIEQIFCIFVVCYTYIAHIFSVALLGNIFCLLFGFICVFTPITVGKYIFCIMNGNLIDLKVEISAGRMEENLEAPKMA